MYKFQVYRDNANEYRWRFLYNGQVMADSAEGYNTARNARRAMTNLWLKMMFAKVEEL